MDFRTETETKLHTGIRNHRIVDDGSTLIGVGNGEDNVSDKAWLRCDVRPGMFDDEVAICITTIEGNVLSFFISSDFVKSFAGKPEEKAISVDVVDRNRDFGVVALPRRTFEGPNMATVPAGSLRFA